MATVHPFRAVTYASRTDLSDVVAPPYDVLDNAGKAALLAKDPRNVVAIDLPHTPAKELGPPAAYEAAGAAFRDWLAGGTLRREPSPVMFAYRQTFTPAGGSIIRRTGMACCVEALPFGPRPGGGILPHEETFSGPKEDRFALMRATRAQLSPVFGLHADEQGKAKAVLERAAVGQPTFTARTADGVLHEVWRISDPATLAAYQAALEGQDVFIADGHHRYTTALNYLKELEGKGTVPSDHPARRAMMVLVGMSDPGLIIWPTHRVLGGMASYSFDAFLAASSADIRTEPIAGGLPELGKALNDLSGMGPLRFALWDFASRRGCVAIPSTPDPLAQRFPDKPRAWRDLTVAFCQYVIVEKICQAKLNGGNPVKWAFPHTIDEVAQIGSGAETGAGGGKLFGPGGAQLAVIVRPTPLEAVRDVSRAGQVMPQKSTFFYPKLATGLFINPLE